MKDLKIRIDSGLTELTLEEDEIYRGSRVILNVSYPGRHSCDGCLTPKRAERVRDWLTRWLAEQKKRRRPSDD